MPDDPREIARARLVVPVDAEQVAHVRPLAPGPLQPAAPDDESLAARAFPPGSVKAPLESETEPRGLTWVSTVL